MRLVWISALKDLKALRRDPFSILFWMGIPLCMGLLIHLVFGGSEVTPQGKLLIADQDNTIASKLLTGAFSQPPLSKMLVTETVDPAAGLDRIGHGEASAYLLIPRGLQAAFLRNQPFRLQLYTNPEQRILPNIVEQSLSMMVDASFYLQKSAGGLWRGLDVPTAPDAQSLSRMSLGLFQRAEALGKYIYPPLIRFEVETIQEKRQNPNVAALFFPAMVFMTMLLMANGLSGEIWRERLLGTARRLATTPGSFAAFLGGRVIVVVLVYSLVASVGVAATRWLGGPQEGHLPAAAAWATLTGTVFYLLLLPLSLHASSERGADVMGNLLVFPLSLIGGCFFPFEMMPHWMAAIGRLTPNGWAVTQFRAILSGSAEPAKLAVGSACLMAAGAAAFLLSVRRLRGVFLA